MLQSNPEQFDLSMMQSFRSKPAHRQVRPHRLCGFSELSGGHRIDSKSACMPNSLDRAACAELVGTDSFSGSLFWELSVLFSP